ncbi:MAG: MerR family transcriptional regulator [Clostridium sp.]|nr:MerR family transcriptional regulator [Clostridium sp.]MCM1173203.1 MerR family transcriptional regulator [Clostridium sp.]MCM1208318.1 MerR family transcriptional regulator [Ruminococcus sp.]
MESFMIKDATKKLGIEAHVLRYWEEELGLEIKRNSMGHRYYDEKDIRMFGEIKRLRNEGISLKEIRASIERMKGKGEKEEDTTERINGTEAGDTEEIRDTSETKAANGIEEKENGQASKGSSEICVIHKSELEGETDKDKKEKDNIVDFKSAQMQTLMNKIVANAFRENKSMLTNAIKSEITEDVMKQMDVIIREKEEREEARFRRLDECLRQIQRANEEVAATRTKRRFGRKRY